MVRRRIHALFLTTAAMMGCALLTNLDGLAGDAGADAGVDVAPDGFTFTLAPTEVIGDVDAGPVNVAINVTRGASFDGRIDFVVTGGVGGVTASPPSPALSGQTTSSFFVTIGPGAPLGDFALVVTGTSGNLPPVQRTLGVHVGTLLTPDDAGTIVVPSYASLLDIKAWGAGGSGASAEFGPQLSGGPGGGGGFAYSRFAVIGGSTLHVVQGPGGKWSSGGGSLVGVQDGQGAWLLIAGSGGGGGSGSYSGVPGGGGGGVTGSSGGGKCGGQGGSATAGGAISTAAGCDGGANKAGGSLVGGTSSGPAGQGGYGFFGGAGGYSDGILANNGLYGGGGGGSGHVSDAGLDATLVAADGATPPMTNDPDYVSGVGVGGMGGDLNHLNDSGTAGGPGRVVVRLVP